MLGTKKEADRTRRQWLDAGANGVSRVYAHELPWLDRLTVAALKETLHAAITEWDHWAQMAAEPGDRRIYRQRSRRTRDLYRQIEGYGQEIQRGGL